MGIRDTLSVLFVAVIVAGALISSGGFSDVIDLVVDGAKTIADRL